MNLEQFLTLPDVSEMKKEINVKLNNENVKFTISAMNQNEHKNYQKRCQSPIKKGGIDFDMGKFNLLIISNHIVTPNFNDAEFLKKANCVNAQDFLVKKFPAGVIADISQKIIEFSGFDNELDEDIEEAKN